MSLVSAVVVVATVAVVVVVDKSELLHRMADSIETAVANVVVVEVLLTTAADVVAAAVVGVLDLQVKVKGQHRGPLLDMTLRLIAATPRPTFEYDLEVTA
jgi:hypothetical protein